MLPKAVTRPGVVRPRTAMDDLVSSGTSSTGTAVTGRKMQDSTQLRPSGAVRLLARSLEQSAMLAWARRGEMRAIPAAATSTSHSSVLSMHDGIRPLRFAREPTG